VTARENHKGAKPMAKCNKLWTKTAFAKVPPIGATEKIAAENKVALVKIFCALSDHRHYVLEYDPETTEAFVLTTNGDVCELGYILLSELQEMNDNWNQRNPETGRRRFLFPPWERELHGTPSAGYNIGKVQEAHARQWNQPVWNAAIADGRAEVIPT